MTRGRLLLELLLPPVLISGVCLAGLAVSYLVFHTLAELASVVVGAMALVVSVTSRRFTRNQVLVFISIGLGWCAALDLVHAMAYKGMGLFPGDDSNRATQLWLFARFLQAVTLLAAPLFFHRFVPVGYLNAIFALYVAAALLLVFTGNFPTVFVEGQGLTAFKIYAEYAIILLLFLAVLGLWRRRSLISQSLFSGIAVAVALMIVSELAFTTYVGMYDSVNVIGHLLKIFAYWFIFLALVQNTLRDPFSMLSRVASTYDAVPDPAIVISDDGYVLQVNRAALAFAGLRLEQMTGASSHAVLHDSRRSAANCPVCARLARGERRFVAEIERNGTSLECSVAPVVADDGGTAHVEIMRDVTERKRLVAEREELVGNLRERIKELGCMYAISEMTETPGLTVPQLLAGTVQVLPSAFLNSRIAQANFSGDWGSFGTATGSRCIEQRLLVDGKETGTLRVCYPDDVTATADPFLPEERALLASIAVRLGDVISRVHAAERIQRLTYLYDMLSATNRAIVRCRSADELLAQLFNVLVQRGAFPMLFLARADTAGTPLHIVRHWGIDVTLLPMLEKNIVDPDSAFGRLYGDLGKGRVIFVDIPADSPSDQWLNYLRSKNIRQRGILPLLQDGKVFGVIGLYTQAGAEFDPEHLRLLDEMASDMAFALDGMLTAERQMLTEQRANLSEHRFRGLFQHSPQPTQIFSVSTGEQRMMNNALQQWLGYTLADVPTVDAWFEQVYEDSALRRELMTVWQQEQAVAGRTGEPRFSPELTLRCKDGSRVHARGSMTVVGDDTIVGWTDLTGIRNSETALRESEQRFRTMIEQTVTGIYVRREGRFVYVNPGFCEMTGYTGDELIGRNVLELTVPDPDNLRQINAAWTRLEAGGGDGVHYSVPLRRKDGIVIQLDLHAKNIDWPGGRATIVMVEDITERRRAEDRIGQHVEQLKNAMKGTLEVVSRMIDVRDPYTAGHERRVGQIASAIAGEMGWSADRCEALDMIGMVHDIGKISVPTEILVKPTRLSPMEMDMVRGHAQAGYEILKDIQFEHPVAEVIRQHHERIDGSGYPRGLKGEDIMPEARVIAVADVVESMASHRPYRPALGITAALAELEQGRGRLYDAAVVDAMLRLVRERGYQLPD